MRRRPRTLLDQIEAGAHNSRTDLVELLRKCITLGGQAGSGELRDWARRELDGYRGSDVDLPQYRFVTAPLKVDSFQGTWQVTGQQISTLELPDFAVDSFSKGLAINMGAGELQRLAAKANAVDLQPAGMDDLVYFMNRSPEYDASIQRIYYSVSPLAFAGILDTIRTNLVAVVAEIRAAGVDATGVPTPAVADQAFNVVIKGRARANIAVGEGAHAIMTVSQPTPEDNRLPGWVRGPWAIALGLATLAGGVAAIATWVDWNPFA